ncbi:MAG TPA: hypothetical protein VI341_13640 [Actinomycetota bacterium]
MAATALAGTTGAVSDATPTLTLKTGGGAVSAGDLCVAFLGYDNAITVSDAVGFTPLVGATFTGGIAHILYKNCAGGETTWTPTMSAGERAEWVVVHIPAGEWHGTTVPEINTVATGSSTTPNPGNATPSWGTDSGVATLYIASCFADDSATPFPITGWPTNYGLINVESAGDGTASACDVAVAGRSVSAASDDAPAFTMTSTETWAAYTVMVRGPAAAGGDTLVPIIGAGYYW